MTFEPHFTVTHRVTADLTRIERARGFLEAATLWEDWIRQMGAGALILEAHHTTHIEGTKLSLDESERLLAGEAVPGADPEDVRELLNYSDAFEFVSAWLGSGGPITEGLVREIHKRLVDGVRGGSAAPGEYRRLQNYVVNSATGAVIYTPPPAHDVPILMREALPAGTRPDVTERATTSCDTELRQAPTPATTSCAIELRQAVTSSCDTAPRPDRLLQAHRPT